MIKKIALSFLSVVLLLLGAGFYPFQSERLTDVTQNVINAYSDECTVGRIRLSLWRGVLVKNIRMTIRSRAGTAFDVQVPLLQLKWSVPSLLRRKIIVRDAIVARPVVTVDVNSKAGAPGPQAMKKKILPLPDLARQLDWPVLISRIVAGKGVILIVKDGFEIVRATGVQMKMQFRKGRVLNCRGKLQAKSVILGGQWAMTRVESGVFLYNEKLSLNFLEGDLYDGKAAGDISLLLLSNRINRLELSVSNMALAQFYQDWKGRQGQLSGRVNARLSFDPCALLQDSISGRGRVEIRDVAARNLALHRNFPKKEYVSLLNPVSFTEIKGDVDVHGGRIHIPQWIGQGGQADFTLSGWLDYKGLTALGMTLVLSKQLCESLPALVNYSLVPMGDGRSRLRLFLSGLMADPDVKINEKVFKRTVNRAFRDLGKSIKKMF